MIHTCYHTVIHSSNGVKRYFGKHSTRNLNDGYIGSGKYIDRIKKKYHINVIDRCFFDTESDAYEFEELLISEAKEKYGKMCVNMKPGGRGGCSFKQSEETKLKRSKALKGRKRPKEVINSILKTKSKRVYEVSQKTRDKMRLSKLGKKVKISEDRLIAIAKANKERGLLNRSKLWDYFDELYTLWLNENKPGKRIFRKILISKGYPDLDCGHMVKKFIELQERK